MIRIGKFLVVFCQCSAAASGMTNGLFELVCSLPLEDITLFSYKGGVVSS